jgi:hypothetical protein
MNGRTDEFVLRQLGFFSDRNDRCDDLGISPTGITRVPTNDPRLPSGNRQSVPDRICSFEAAVSPVLAVDASAAQAENQETTVTVPCLRQEIAPAKSLEVCSALVRRLALAQDDPAKQRIRVWLGDIDDDRLFAFGLTPDFSL